MGLGGKICVRGTGDALGKPRSLNPREDVTRNGLSVCDSIWSLASDRPVEQAQPPQRHV